jgi:3-oxoadipate enol-lactonase
MDHREMIKSIKAPTMVIAGKQDAGTTPEMGEAVAKSIPGANLKLFDAAHIANIECGKAYTDAVLAFLLEK